jgi:hypothetical protein
MVRTRRCAATLLALAPWLSTVSAPSSEAATTPTEYEVKAAYLYPFATFVAWPPRGERDPFVITILGDDPFGVVIDETLAGKSVDGRRVVVRRIVNPQDLGACQILFISDSERTHLVDILRRLEGVPTLTVGEMERFAERGGAIRFHTEASRVRLEINVAVAARARLKISSELLKLAKIVGERAPD